MDVLKTYSERPKDGYVSVTTKVDGKMIYK